MRVCACDVEGTVGAKFMLTRSAEAFAMMCPTLNEQIMQLCDYAILWCGPGEGSFCNGRGGSEPGQQNGTESGMFSPSGRHHQGAPPRLVLPDSRSHPDSGTQANALVTHQA